VNASTDSQTSPILVFCSTLDKDVYPGKIFPAGYDNTISVAATNKTGHLRLASQDSVDILIPNEDINADVPVYMERYISEFMPDVTTPLASGIASLVLLLLRRFNDDQAVLKEFLLKQKFMQVFAGMDSGHSGIELSQLFRDFCGNEVASRWAAANFA